MYVWRKPVYNRIISKHNGRMVTSHLAVGKSDGCVQSGSSDLDTAKAIREKKQFV